MTLEATGIISLPLDNCRNLLAACEAMQAWVGVAPEDIGQPAGVAEAKARIHLWGVTESADDSPAEQAARQPRVQLDYADGMESRKEAEGQTYWNHDGPIQATFTKVSVGNQSYEEACTDLSNSVGAILADLEALAGTDVYFNVTRWDMPMAPARQDPIKVTAGELDIVGVEITLHWGDV